MNDSITRISLDVHDAGSSVSVHAKRGDTGRVIIISLVDGGVPYVITKDCTAVFTGQKANGNVLYNDCTILQNTIIYAFTDNTVAAAGRINCEIKLYGADGKLITSPKFTINVQETVYNEGDEIESTDEFNALTVLVAEATEAIQSANQVAEELEEARVKGEFNGPPGEQGPKGDKGDTGDKGDKGDTGDKGDKGDPGKDGAALIDDEAVRMDAAWSSKNTVDRLCPAFEESGVLIQCEPVEGYPLEVIADGEFVVTVCGKNLYETDSYEMTKDRFINLVNGSVNTTTSGYCATLGFIPVSHLVGQKIYLNYRPGGSNPGMAFYSEDKSVIVGSGGKGDGIIVPEGAAFMRFTSLTSQRNKIQIEIGDRETAYEDYKTSDVIFDGQKFTASSMEGINTVFAYSGDNAVEITVTGRADPIALINSLTSRVAELEKIAVGNT